MKQSRRNMLKGMGKSAAVAAAGATVVAQAAAPAAALEPVEKRSPYTVTKPQTGKPMYSRGVAYGNMLFLSGVGYHQPDTIEVHTQKDPFAARAHTKVLTKLIPESKFRAIGVTRVARVTGLDRTGIEVACAVRPLGHVLQVSQGKGLDWKSAVASAIGEAAELHAAERPDPRQLRFAAAVELPGEVWLPGELSGATSPALAGPEVLQGWALAQSERGPVWVPASAVFCPPGDVEWIGPATSIWTSNGLGAGPTLAHARRHGLFELLERAALNVVLPEGWTAAQARARLLEWRSPLLDQLAQRGFPTYVFDCTPRGWKMPIVAALLFDREGGPIPVTAGYACRARPAEAALAAVLEAAQSRVTEIHGAREDVLFDRRQDGVELLEVLRGAKPKKRLSALPSLHGPRVPLPRGLRTAVVDLTNGPLRVARVFARGVRHSELLE